MIKISSNCIIRKYLTDSMKTLGLTPADLTRKRNYPKDEHPFEVYDKVNQIILLEAVV